MSSTTAGARFGFALVGLILLTNLIKYPFLRVGTRFTAATGLSLLEGFQKRNPLYLPLYLVVSLVTGTFTCLLYTSPSPRDRQKSRMPSSA